MSDLLTNDLADFHLSWLYKGPTVPEEFHAPYRGFKLINHYPFYLGEIGGALYTPLSKHCHKNREYLNLLIERSKP